MRPIADPRLLVAVAHDPADDPLRITTLPEGSSPKATVPLSAPDIAAWARAYVRAQQDPRLLLGDGHPQWWAVERLLLFSAAGRYEDCWQVILGVLQLTSDPDVLGVLAAGPLEDLIEHAGPVFVDRIERQARTDPAFRGLLAGTWPCGSPAVWRRVEAARRAASGLAGQDLPDQVH